MTLVAEPGALELEGPDDPTALVRLAQAAAHAPRGRRLTYWLGGERRCTGTVVGDPWLSEDGRVVYVELEVRFGRKRYRDGYPAHNLTDPDDAEPPPSQTPARRLDLAEGLSEDLAELGNEDGGRRASERVIG